MTVGVPLLLFLLLLYYVLVRVAQAAEPADHPGLDLAELLDHIRRQHPFENSEGCRADIPASP